MPRNNDSIRFPEFIIHLDTNLDNFVVESPSVLEKINIIALEPKIFFVF